MSKSPAQNKILNTLSQTLPDDRPITAIQIIENIEKCPSGFVVISRTHDQDQDADLWRTSLLFKKTGRYLCLSKTEGLPNHVVEEISIIGDKDLPPQGYSMLQRTADTEQKAWRKRQLCYRLMNVKNISKAVTDIIICNRIKQAPTGFTYAGEINGMIVCFKLGNITPANSLYANSNGSRVPPERPPKPLGLSNVAYPPLADDSDHDYERLLPSYMPKRPAPKPPGNSTENGPCRAGPQPPANRYNTLIVYHGLEGVPFVLNPKLGGPQSSDKIQLPVIKQRSMPQLKKDYDYDFRVERET